VQRILDVLAAQHVRAIFFPIGSWAKANPALVRRIAAAGHLVGDHTRDHIDLAKVSERRAHWEIHQGMTHTRGSVPLLRPPFGAGAYTARLHQLAADTGVQLCTWTVDTRDWTGSSAGTIVRRVRHGDAITPRVKAGGVVIMHMNGDHTGKALPGVIAAVRERGLTLHRLSARAGLPVEQRVSTG
jgi:peptidoglycan/xylan/chitin deacetylase (PgdA/CDA1 family)